MKIKDQGAAGCILVFIVFALKATLLLSHEFENVLKWLWLVLWLLGVVPWLFWKLGNSQSGGNVFNWIQEKMKLLKRLLGVIKIINFTCKVLMVLLQLFVPGLEVPTTIAAIVPDPKTWIFAMLLPGIVLNYYVAELLESVIIFIVPWCCSTCQSYLGSSGDETGLDAPLLSHGENENTERMDGDARISGDTVITVEDETAL